MQRCTQCVLDTLGNSNISFDAHGVCVYCKEYARNVAGRRLSSKAKEHKLGEAVALVKAAGKGRRYDCILGLSGGMDSSYLAYLAKKFELRPLAVHLDNGWDSELAVQNIENILNKTGFDYYNHVVDWDEFKDIQLAYLKASVIDTEVVTDQAIFALLHRTAREWGIKYILFGDNPATERIIPRGWNYRKNDKANLLAIQRRYGTKRIETYPLMGQYDLLAMHYVHGIRYTKLLHYVDFDVKVVSGTLEREFEWRDYGWKHCESVFTKFYQGYILPRKFGVDKRKAHLSDLILSGQITRGVALGKLETPYYDDESFQTDYDFVLRKFELTEQEFQAILQAPPVPHESFPREWIGQWRDLKRTWLQASNGKTKRREDDSTFRTDVSMQG